MTLCDLLTHHPARRPDDLVFVSDLAAELARWLTGGRLAWTERGVTDAVALLHRRSEVPAAPVGPYARVEVAVLAGDPQPVTTAARKTLPAGSVTSWRG